MFKVSVINPVIKENTQATYTYAVDFSYERIPKWNHKTSKWDDVTVTYAYITNITNNSKWRPKEDCVTYGFATCESGDIFDKNKGRKIALLRALKDFTNDRLLRKEFWRNYRNTVTWTQKWEMDDEK